MGLELWLIFQRVSEVKIYYFEIDASITNTKEELLSISAIGHPYKL